LAAGITHRGELAARYGGEEFVLLLPHSTPVQAHSLAEKIRNQVQQLQIPHHASNVAPCVTVSIGVVSLLGAGPASTPESLLKAADDALYQAKRAGRNRVIAVTNQG
jgi:diguanylate cyclase (GGDEF)-like protein